MGCRRNPSSDVGVFLGVINETLKDLNQAPAATAVVRGQPLTDAEVELLAMVELYRRWDAEGAISKDLVDVFRSRVALKRYGLVPSFVELVSKMNSYGLVASFGDPPVTDRNVVISPIVRSGRQAVPAIKLKRAWDEHVDRDVRRRLEAKGVVLEQA